MALDYTGKVVVRGKQIQELGLEQLYKDNSIAKGIIVVNSGDKHGVTKTETSSTAVEQAYTGSALTGDGDFTLFDYQVNHVKTETKIDILQDTLRDTPFADDMAPGAMNIDSSRFMQLAADQLGTRVAYNASVQRWKGATAATKAAIAALTPGAGQGSITAAMQTKVAALPTSLRDGFLVASLYNNWNKTKTAGLGTYLKVTGTTLTAANVAAEFAAVYAKIPVVERDNTLTPYIINAPLTVKAFIMIANNSVGAASNKNFAVEGAGLTQRISYNDIEINFVELLDNVMIGAPKGSFEYNCDMESDDNVLEVGEYAGGSDVKYYRNIQAWSVHVSRQDKNVVYGG